MTSAANKIAQGLTMRNQQRQQQTEGNLMGNAMMGDTQSLHNLYMYNPQLAAQVQQRNEQMAAARQQAELVSQQKKRESLVAYQDYLQNTVMPNAAKIGDDAQARQYIERLSIERANALGLPDPTNMLKPDLENPDFINQLRQVYGESEIPEEFLNEERKYAKESVTGLKKRASEVNTSYNKIDGLMSTIRDPEVPAATKRIAIASAITNLARILSPGIVTDRDFANLTGGSTSVGAVLSYVKDKDANLANVLEGYAKNLDPTNPAIFDPEGFLQVATKAVASEAPTILQGYQEAQERATTAGMSKRAYDTNFGSSESILSLRKFLPQQQPSATITEDDKALYEDYKKGKNL